MSSQPLISVVVFVLNAVDTIEKALRSVTAEDQPRVELLVMDGGSTDGTLDVIRRYESKIAYWRSYADGSAVIAMNEGVQRATGDIICFLPADDWIEPGALKLVCDEFAADPLLEVLSCGARFVHLDADGAIHGDAEFLDAKLLEFSMEGIVRHCLTGGRFIVRRLYAEVGEHNSAYRLANDLDFLIRVLLKRPRTKVITQLVYSYRQHPGSRTLGGDPRMIRSMMSDAIEMAEHHLLTSPLAQGERAALLGLHGRASARLAWMLFSRGEIAAASRVLWHAIGRNPLWPIQLFQWLGQKWLRRD